MTLQLLLLILAGPFLAVLPAVLAAAPQIPGFWGSRPAPRRNTDWVRTTSWAVPA